MAVGRRCGVVVALLFGSGWLFAPQDHDGSPAGATPGPSAAAVLFTFDDLGGGASSINVYPG